MSMTTFEGKLQELILSYFSKDLGQLKEVIMRGEKCTLKTVYDEFDCAPFGPPGVRVIGAKEVKLFEDKPIG